VVPFNTRISEQSGESLKLSKKISAPVVCSSHAVEDYDANRNKPLAFFLLVPEALTLLVTEKGK